MELVWSERSQPIAGGFALSVLFHVALAVVAIVIVPLFKVQIEVTPPGIEATIVSDITAAPKVDKAGKPEEKPKPPQPPAPEQTKPAPPKPAPPVTPTQSAPPPAAAPEKTVAIPDETKKVPEEKKKEEPKPEEKKAEKKPDEKKEKKQDQDFNSLLANLTKDQPAPDTKEKAKPKAKPAPAKPTTGPQTAMLTEGPPMTASENDAIRQQLIPCWNFDPGVPNPEDYTVVVRITVREDGLVTGAQIEDTSRMGDPTYRSVAESAVRTVQNPECAQLKLPPGKYWPQMDVVFDLAKAINGGY
jgi:hypothetical protein